MDRPFLLTSFERLLALRDPAPASGFRRLDQTRRRLAATGEDLFLQGSDTLLPERKVLFCSKDAERIFRARPVSIIATWTVL
jgi:hypothetical protein